MYANCHACRNRYCAQLRERADAAIAERQQIATLPDAFEATIGDDAAEGIDTVAVDEFDATFGDGADLMDIDLPADSAVSAREATLLKNLDEKLGAIKFETCDSCWEEGFDLDTKDGMCGSCRRDNDPVLVKKWSEANAVHPGA
jgi:hypothetical protein